MLPTFVIGLREGLEAALIVGIIAAFLTRNGKPLRGMWIGVGLAVAVSILVGVALELLQQSLPQRQQEMLETVIGAVAVVFVTTMILWMNKNARFMKRDLEAEATAALASGTTRALAVMAFLAVLKEGFESAVFLLATLQASTTVFAAASGAILGIGVSCAIGYGIYTGGVRLDLRKFFLWTTPFLILVAAGLVVATLRTAHEAGWILIGQAPTVDLSWLAPNGTIRAALITGVLGIPADPRVVEVLGWCAYVVTMTAIVFWPKRLTPAAANRPRFAFVGAGLLAVCALALAAFWPRPALPEAPTTVTLEDGRTAHLESVPAETLTLILSAPDGTVTEYPFDSGTGVSRNGSFVDWHEEATDTAPDSSLTLGELVELNDGTVPIGIDRASQPGPYDAVVTTHETIDLTTYAGGIVDLTVTDAESASLSGGGLAGTRTIGLADTSAGIVDDGTTVTAAEVTEAEGERADALLFKVWVPVVMGLAALGVLGLGLRRKRALEPSPETAPPQPQKSENLETHA